ncbi:MAG: HEAT repeat domain-containing protein [Cyanobacteria bacterium CRU_2_1]|nr:HEAT repeat domain-containing protein [Cyanobacteria bacterium RU_5_0]NJR59922.1 HEAT repeat domain-containing protein [Cyanobacteria bacterium CRU_2_1]
MVTTTPASAEPIVSAETAIAALRSHDNQTRYYAAWWLGKYQVQDALIPLCEALSDEDYRTAEGGYPLRRQAARALGQLKNPQAVPALLDVLSCSDLRLREVVIQTLAAIADPQAVQPLLQLLVDGGEQPHEVLIEALGTLNVWEAKPWIEPFLNHSSERVQCAAARYFYLLTQKPEYIERIVRNLDHENMYLRWAAAFDLGAIGHLEAANAIISAKIGNGLKLLNLKRILESVLNSDLDENKKQEKVQFLLQAIDKLLIQL